MTTGIVTRFVPARTSGSCRMRLNDDARDRDSGCVSNLISRPDGRWPLQQPYDSWLRCVASTGETRRSRTHTCDDDSGFGGLARLSDSNRSAAGSDGVDDALDAAPRRDS